jgi:hypothetical protein
MATRLSGIVSFACGVAAVLVLSAADSRSEPRNPSEIARLRAHFDTVLAELRGASTESLDDSRRTARAELVARLEEYARAGRFPHNHVRIGERVPVFRDEHGTLCAMGYLIASTGRHDVVANVAAHRNLELMDSLADDRRIVAWLDSTGLTLAEAARIQPKYGDGCPGTCEAVVHAGADHAARRRYAVNTAVMGALSATAVAVNPAPADATSARLRWSTVGGIGIGVAQAAYGSWAVLKGDSRRALGMANVAVGAASIAASVWRMRQQRGDAAEPRTVTVQPYAGVDGAGVLLSARM